MSVIIRRLRQDDRVADFDCGDEPINNYLHRHAWLNHATLSIGVTYVAVDESAPSTVLGYFTLAMSSAPRDAMPRKTVRGLPPYDLPLLLLARLGVDRRYSGRGLGKSLMAEAVRTCVTIAESAGCRGIVTDAYAGRAEWYARFGFVALQAEPSGRTLRMFLDIRTLRAARNPLS